MRTEEIIKKLREAYENNIKGKEETDNSKPYSYYEPPTQQQKDEWEEIEKILKYTKEHKEEAEVEEHYITINEYLKKSEKDLEELHKSDYYKGLSNEDKRKTDEMFMARTRIEKEELKSYSCPHPGPDDPIPYTVYIFKKPIKI